VISPQRRPLQQASPLAGRASASPPPRVLRQVVAQKHREPLCPPRLLDPSPCLHRPAPQSPATPTQRNFRQTWPICTPPCLGWIDPGSSKPWSA
jgi:hypothetical protein